MIDITGTLDRLRRLVAADEEEMTEGAVACHLGPGPHTALPRAQMRVFWSLPEEMVAPRKSVRIRRFFRRMYGLRKAG